VVARADARDRERPERRAVVERDARRLVPSPDDHLVAPEEDVVGERAEIDRPRARYRRRRRRQLRQRRIRLGREQASRLLEALWRVRQEIVAQPGRAQAAPRHGVVRRRCGKLLQEGNALLATVQRQREPGAIVERDRPRFLAETAAREKRLERSALDGV